MAELTFTWDGGKDLANARKHGITFAEAATAFADDSGLLRDDPDHSDDEDRFILLGLSAVPRLLIVVHACRQGGDSVRLISARKATRREESAYWKR